MNRSEGLILFCSSVVKTPEGFLQTTIDFGLLEVIPHQFGKYALGQKQQLR